MDEQTVIFWFSGTGNSLYAAKRLAAELDARLVRITGDAPAEAAGGKIGFVFPSYYGNLPRAVRSFVERLEIRPESYIFAVVTMGAAGQGSLSALSKALKVKGLRLSYGRGVHMPANYVLNYNPADPEKCAGTLARADERFKKIAAGIAAGTRSVRSFPLTAGNLYKNIEKLDAGFAAGEGCTGCGLCERLCPVGNIKLENGRPVWQRRCERCVACISWCPAKAIDYNDKTKDRRRYQNPRVGAEELYEQV